MFVPPKVGKAANVSADTHDICDAVATWGRSRWGDVRVLREVALGDRRIDMLFVGVDDIAGVEVKGPRDSLDRLRDQLHEYRYWVPEVWVAIDDCWVDKMKLYVPNQLVLSRDGDGYRVREDPPRPLRSPGFRGAFRDDLCCSRLLELLWRDEAAAIAVRTGVIPARVPKQFKRAKVLAMLARLLTGHEIVKNVCQELRARQMVGMSSDDPMRAGSGVAAADEARRLGGANKIGLFGDGA